MAVDRDGSARRIDRAAPGAERASAPPPDRPGAEGAPSRAASRAAARATGGSDRRPLPEPVPEPTPEPVQPEWTRFPQVTDHSGFSFSEREFAFADVTPEQAWDMHTRRSPLGFRPEQWDRCVAELRAALTSDGCGDAEVRLRGPGARFCSSDQMKWFPQNENELRSRVIRRNRGMSDDERLRRADKAVAKYRTAGFSRERPSPIAPFFDSMYKLGIAEEPDGYEFGIATADLSGRFHDLERAAPALHDWSRRWEDATGRTLTLSEGVGPRDDAWIVVEPEGENG
ncbi:hypothetical protein GCM10022254_49970 [Actinomadura meridiana]|uniref:Uncharacterized protein n=1 Tax=Actinomadura meridiana TaxID=559626 RepID=A0ABP8CCL8_9ACTN